MKDYIINTFASQREKNVNNAIKFYREKTDALLNSMDVEAKHKLLNTINNIDSISQILEEKINTMNLNLTDLENFYNKKISGLEIQKRIQEYNKNVKTISDSLEAGFDTLQFLDYLQNGKNTGNIQSQLPKAIDLSSEKTTLERLVSGHYESASAAGGARARIIGEMVEQILFCTYYFLLKS